MNSRLGASFPENGDGTNADTVPAWHFGNRDMRGCLLEDQSLRWCEALLISFVLEPIDADKIGLAAKAIRLGSLTASRVSAPPEGSAEYVASPWKDLTRPARDQRPAYSDLPSQAVGSAKAV